MTDYQADASTSGYYLYPDAGDPKPSKGAKVQVLTAGGVHITGPWDDSGFYVGWLPLPKRNRAKEEQIALHKSRLPVRKNKG